MAKVLIEFTCKETKKRYKVNSDYTAGAGRLKELSDKGIIASTDEKTSYKKEKKEISRPGAE